MTKSAENGLDSLQTPTERSKRQIKAFENAIGFCGLLMPSELGPQLSRLREHFYQMINREMDAESRSRTGQRL